jgi:hypothetical protein
MKESAVKFLIENIEKNVMWTKKTEEFLKQALNMEKQQQQLDLTNITRLEVINHATNKFAVGRVLTLYKNNKDFTVVEASFQDKDRTLKIFIS